MINAQEIKNLELKANQIRADIITMLLTAGSGHSAGSLGMADVFTALYFGQVLNYQPHHPHWPQRDRLVLSCGHICPVLYATLAHAGFFPHNELKTLRQINSRLQGHPHYGDLPGVEVSSGPLGQGLSQAIGIALALRMDWEEGLLTEGLPYVYCVVSDGEHDEGQLWEAVMFAAKEKLGNLIVLVDRNNIQIDGLTEEVMPLEPLKEKYEAFNWHVDEVDGHNIGAIIEVVHKAKAVFNKPSVVICHTIAGKGVDFMERKWQWHGKPPNKEEAQKALAQLRTLGGKIVSEHE